MPDGWLHTLLQYKINTSISNMGAFQTLYQHTVSVCLTVSVCQTVGKPYVIFHVMANVPIKSLISSWSSFSQDNLSSYGSNWHIVISNLDQSIRIYAWQHYFSVKNYTLGFNYIYWIKLNPILNVWLMIPLYIMKM